MANINFFDKAYLTEAARTDVEFGICDPGNAQPEFTTIDSPLYQAKVNNPTAQILQFVPIDHNFNIRRANGDLESTCDGMLYNDTTYLAFIELKDKESGWASEAVEQLRTTIVYFAANHNRDDFKRRYAYAANVKHPNFHKSFKEVMQQFFAETKFILRFGTVVNV